MPELAARFPELTIVIDHLGKPPLGSDEMARWAAALAAAAAHGNVAAKISGLNTCLASSDWHAADLREASPSRSTPSARIASSAAATGPSRC